MGSYSAKYMAVPGPVPALHVVAKHGSQFGEGILCAYTVIAPLDAAFDITKVVVVECEREPVPVPVIFN